MKITVSVFFYTIIFCFFGTVMIAFALHLFDLSEVIFKMQYAYDDWRARIILGLSGLVMIFLSFAAARIVTGKIQREKTIAFSNPNGQVTVTLSAVEDLIKRLAHQLSEIKDAKASVKATKKGIDIGMRLVLRSETNIPEYTARLQELIANKIQEVFGLDEAINVKIHVAKIITVEERSKKKIEATTEDISVPYQRQGMTF